jgi:hypothetical protein
MFQLQLHPLRAVFRPTVIKLHVSKYRARCIG